MLLTPIYLSYEPKNEYVPYGNQQIKKAVSTIYPIVAIQLSKI